MFSFNSSMGKRVVGPVLLFVLLTLHLDCLKKKNIYILKKSKSLCIECWFCCLSRKEPIQIKWTARI